MKDHYATLGVAKDASADEIKRAFRRLASQHHPDKGGDTRKFQEIQAAYEVLGNEQKRAEYDNPAQPFQFQNFGGSGFPFSNIHDIFNMFGQGGQHPRRNHVRMSLYINLSDVATGGRRTVSVSTSQGSQTVEIDIPLGLNDGDSVQYSGIAPGGQDLVITFRIQPHRQWHRNALDLTTERAVSVWDLIVGGDITVEDILGSRITVRIPAKCQPGTALRIRGHGLKDRAGRQGDMFLRLAAKIPDVIPEELVEAIQKYRQ